jgi:HEAT repeat protein
MTIDRSALSDELRKALTYETVKWRSHRLALFAEVAGVEAFCELQCLARSQDIEERCNAVRGLRYVNTREATDELCRLARDDDPQVVEHAIPVLGHRHDPKVIDALAEIMLHHNDGTCRVFAASVLRGLRAPAAADAFREALRDYQTEDQAAIALGELGEEGNIKTLLDAWPDQHLRLDLIPLSIAKIGGRVAALALSDLLAAEEDSPRRLAIIRALCEVCHADAVPGLLLGLTDKDREAQMAAYDGLFSMPYALLREGLEIALIHQSPLVRLKAATLAAPYADKTIVDALTRLAATDPDVAKAAQHTLEEVRRWHAHVDARASES